MKRWVYELKPLTRTSLVSATVVLLAAAAFAVLLNGCAKKDVPLETVRIGPTMLTGALIHIADEKGFFTRHGIRAVIKDYELGPSAINGLSNGEDVVTAAEFVMVRQSFDNPNLRTFAQIANAKSMIALVGRKDRGINKLSDLKGKKIALSRGTSAEYYLGTFLRQTNIPFSAIDIVNIGGPAAEEALNNGSVDAAVIWEPFATRMKERLMQNAVSWSIQGRDDYYFLLITKEEFLRRSPATAEKILRALIDAEDFAGKHPDEARRIVESKTILPDVRLVLGKSTLKVGLDQGLLALMEAEAQWMIRNNLTSKKEMPNYLRMIYLKGLEAVKPEAVKVIH